MQQQMTLFLNFFFSFEFNPSQLSSSIEALIIKTTGISFIVCYGSLNPS